MNEFISMTDLGTIFGVSSHKIGKWLMSLGLRTSEMKPSRKAFDGGFVKQAPTGRGQGYFYLWHRERTLRALEAAGYCRVDQDAANQLIGPFSARLSSANGFEIVGSDGATAVWVVGKENATTLVKLMNVAHDHGWCCNA